MTQPINPYRAFIGRCFESNGRSLGHFAARRMKDARALCQAEANAQGEQVTIEHYDQIYKDWYLVETFEPGGYSVLRRVPFSTKGGAE